MARIIAIFTELNCFWIHTDEVPYSDSSPPDDGSSSNHPSTFTACCQCCHSCGKFLSPNGPFLSHLSSNSNGNGRHIRPNTLCGLSPMMSYTPCVQYSSARASIRTSTHASLTLDCTSMLCVNSKHRRQQQRQHDRTRDAFVKSVQLISCRNMKSYSFDKGRVGLDQANECRSVAMVGYSSQNGYGLCVDDEEEVLLRGLGILLGSKMLQELLAGDGNIDPEILAALDEEQKQILFCKMREEQVRRYYERDRKIEVEKKKNNNNAKKKNGISNKKHIDFLLGADQNVWVWVMGDFPGDLTIDQILEQEAKKEAEEKAEKEAETLRVEEETELTSLKAEEERMEKEQREREDKLRKQAEAEYQSAKEAREAQRRLEEEKKNTEEQQKSKFEDLKRKLQQEQSREVLRRKERRRTSIKEIEGMKSKRSSEIYLSIQEVRLKLERDAKKQQEETDKEWMKQEEKAKRLESQIRQVARKARLEWRKSMTPDTNDLARVAMEILKKQKQNTQNGNPTKPSVPPPAVPKKPAPCGKPARPTSRAAIIQWYKETERSKGAGFDSKTHQIAGWFHGPISREAAEELLEEKQAGSYLVRVSERIFGYAISYRSEVRCKHYLINALDNKYEFFGTNQITHNNLQDLVNFHKKTPISNSGVEILKFPVGQTKDPPDYCLLFDDDTVTKL